MDNKFKVYFSNQVERLYPKLKEELFSSSSSFPFTKRTVIVPSPAMKSWLNLRFAHDEEIGIAAGFRIQYLEAAIAELANQHTESKQTRSTTLSQMELALKIEGTIRHLIVTENGKDGILWQPLFKYLCISKQLSKKSNKRIIALSDKLAALFIQYEKYAPVMLQEWETARNGGWQEELWRRVVGEASIFPKDLKASDSQVHLFAVSFLSRKQHEFLSTLSCHIPVSYYLLSPCQAFWSDLLSDKQCVKIQQYWQQKGISLNQQNELDRYLYDRNPLLANFGRLGREMAHLVEDASLTHEEYTIPQAATKHYQYKEIIHSDLYTYGENRPLTMLEAIQSDLLLLRNPQENEKVRLEKDDKSLQIHIAPKIHREIEIIYDVLLGIIEKHAGDPEPIYPGDIVVMAPDIMVYEPYIREVFESQDSKLVPQLMDLHLLSRNELIQGYLHLISLSNGRWDSASLLRLLDFPSFCSKFYINNADAEQIRKWIKDSDVRWGEDSEHRNNLLKNEHCVQSMIDDNPSGTWSFAMDRLLMGLAMESSDDAEDFENENAISAIDVDNVQAELLGKWLRIFRSLRTDLLPLNNGAQMNIFDWSNFLEAMLESYFSPDNQKDNSDESYQHLRTIIKGLCNESVSLELKYPFSSIHHHILGQIEKERVSFRENDLKTVRFCSMLPMRAVPSKVLAVLGMHEGAYPRHENNSSLNLMKLRSDVDYCPSQADFDRYLFLEMLLSCRGYLILSYTGVSEQDGKEQPPSLLVEEVISYMNNSFDLEGLKPADACIWKHPMHPYDKVYFQDGSRFANYSNKYFKQASAYYLSEKSTKYSFLSDFNISKSIDQTAPIQIDLKKLIALAKNPIESYFNNTLGIYLEKDSKRIFKTDEEFLISTLDKAMMKKRSLKQPIDRILRLAENQGKLPLGPFKKNHLDILIEEAKEISNNMERLGINPEACFDIEISDRCQRPEKTPEGKWTLPPLELKLYGKLPVKIVGNLRDAAPEGLLAWIDDKNSDAAKQWPQFLVFSSLIERYALPIKPRLLFGKAGIARDPFFQRSQDELEKYLDYYLAASKNVSPLLPEWLPKFMSSDPDKFMKEIKSSIKGLGEYFFNDYFHWLVMMGADPKSDEMINSWRHHAEALYGELFRQWYPFKVKAGGEEEHETL